MCQLECVHNRHAVKIYFDRSMSNSRGRTRAQTVAAHREMERVAQQQSNAGSNGGNVMPTEAQNNDAQVATQPTGASATVADDSHASAGGREVPISDGNQQTRRTVVAAGDNPNDLVINLSQDEVAWLRERGVGAKVVCKGMNIFHEHLFCGHKRNSKTNVEGFCSR